MLVSLGRRVPWGRWILGAVAMLLALCLIWAGRAIWFPVAIAFIIAMVLDPTVDRLENRGLTRSAATTLVFVLFLGGAILAVLILSPILSDQARRMAGDLARLFPDPAHPSLVPVTQKILEKLDANPVLGRAVLNAARNGTHRLAVTLARGSEFVVAWAPNLVWLIVIPVLTFYTLNDFHRIYAKAILLVPKDHRATAQSLMAEISAVFGKYLRGLGIVCTLLGFAIAALLLVLHSPYWQLFGVLGGLLYAVPVVGGLFTVMLAVLVTLVIGSPSQALVVGLALLALQNGVFDQIITPRIVGKQVGLHPILTILALLLGYQVAGISGMLVAVPLAASVQTIVLHLVPKLGIDLELKPLEELKACEVETKIMEAEAEERITDEHFRLQSVVDHVENVEQGKHAGNGENAGPVDKGATGAREAAA